MSSDSVITTDDLPVTPVKTPKGFNDLKKPELVKAAEYFGTESEGNVDALRADLLENGISWAMYHNVFVSPEAPLPLPETEDTFKQVDVEDWEDAEEVIVTEQIITAPAVPVLTQEKYLIRMVRENPYFEFKNYKFTQEKPYAIMSAADAEEILSNERDFRQAFPSELQEYYS